MLSRALFDALAESRSMQSFVSKYGLRRPDSFARRFVAGETVADAIAVARQIEASGAMQTLAYLGPRATTMAEADAATRAGIATVNDIAAAGIGRNLSLKLTQFGLSVDRATCVDNLRRLLDPAAAQDVFVRIDMEDSRYTQVTFDVFETLWQQGYRNAGVVLQSYLARSADDARRMIALGARVRLVKGAFAEARRVAFRSKAQIDRAFSEIMELLLNQGTQPAFATHDTALIDATKAFAAARGIAPDRYEFQMLYGVRPDLQASLTRSGYRVRVYVPFGREWFRYVMFRLGQRPSEIGAIVRGLVPDR
jgi:proline dehydrogenase